MFFIKRHGLRIGGIQITRQAGGIGSVQDGLDDFSPQTLPLMGGRHGENQKIPVRLGDILPMHPGK